MVIETLYKQILKFTNLNYLCNLKKNKKNQFKFNIFKCFKSYFLSKHVLTIIFYYLNQFSFDFLIGVSIVSFIRVPNKPMSKGW